MKAQELLEMRTSLDQTRNMGLSVHLCLQHADAVPVCAACRRGSSLCLQHAYAVPICAACGHSPRLCSMQTWFPSVSAACGCSSGLCLQHADTVPVYAACRRGSRLCYMRTLFLESGDAREIDRAALWSHWHYCTQEGTKQRCFLHRVIFIIIARTLPASRGGLG